MTDDQRRELDRIFGPDWEAEVLETARKVCDEPEPPMTPGDPCCDCGQPTYPARDGVYDGVVCKACRDRDAAEQAAWEASLTDEERADINRRADRAFREKVLPLLESRRQAAAYLTDDASRFVARKLHSQGIEMTPDQVTETRDSALARIRRALTEQGIPVPPDDVGLMAMMRDAFRAEKEGQED